MSLVAVAACLTASVLAAVRWLRVAQREHYLPGSVTSFAVRWWWGLGFNRLLTIGIVVDLILSTVSPFFAILGAAAVAVGPFGLRLRGHAPGPTNWTRRLRTLAAIWAAITLLLVGVGALAGAAHVAAYLVAIITPAVVDAALAVAQPLEARLAQKWIDQAKERLRSVAPHVIAITGSYGKTSTKGYVAHLVQGSRTVVATPASFNNAMGLSRAINENLAPGTEVFVAEMGTYGPGEIAAMVEWVQPSSAAITAIGPVHLERMKTEDRIAGAKSEILTTASTVALNVDDARLAKVADAAAAQGKRVVRCSATDRSADVAVLVDGAAFTAWAGGTELARFDGGDHAPTNIAVAIALASAAGVPNEVIAKRLATLPTASNRRALETAESGAVYIDDTYNSNPSGAHAALATLQRMGEERNANRIVLVTPGMVELGPRQAEENARFASAASEICTDIVIIGMTNRKALLSGAHEGRARVSLVDDRAGARAWVKENAGASDVVLFENDLPDHFP